MSGDDRKGGDNVVRLGTETLYAIGEELRRMYEADLNSKPSAELRQLMRQIENGEDVEPPPVLDNVTQIPER
jgi:hypothetical protein